jgi:plastocyanin
MTGRVTMLLRASIVLLLALAAGAFTAPAASAAKATTGCTQTAADGTKSDWTCFWGPVDVAGYEVRQEVTGNIPKPPVDGAITRMDVDVTNVNGQPMSIKRLMLHHIVFLNVGEKFGDKQDATCDRITMFDARTTLPAQMERFYAAGEERATLDLPPGYGYGLKKAETWGIVWMFMNHRAQSDKAFIRYRVSVDTAPDLVRTTPYWLDAANCNADPVWSVEGGGKPGSVDVRTATFTMPQSGRIVAAGGHVHGGAKELAVSQPTCSDRRLWTHRPAWAPRDHPFYTVKPILHEPGPLAMSAMRSQQGIPVAAGEQLELSAVYDNSRLHTRVMGISVLHLAPDASVTERCGALPADLAEPQTTQPHRTALPTFTVPLTGLDARGRAREIARPPGATRRVPSGTTVRVGDNFFSRPNVEVRAGSRLNWRFGGVQLHNVTVASGPRGFSSDNLDQQRVYTRKLTAKGTYKLFCALHPVAMAQTVKVR